MGSVGPSITLYQIFPFGGNRAENFIVLDLHKGQPGPSWNGDIYFRLKGKEKILRQKIILFPWELFFFLP